MKKKILLMLLLFTFIICCSYFLNIKIINIKENYKVNNNEIIDAKYYLHNNSIQEYKIKKLNNKSDINKQKVTEIKENKRLLEEKINILNQDNKKIRTKTINFLLISYII